MCRLSSVSKCSTTGTYYYFGNKRLMEVNFRFNITSKINEFLTMIKVYVIFWYEYGSKENYYNWIYKTQYGFCCRGVHTSADNIKRESSILNSVKHLSWENSYPLPPSHTSLWCLKRFYEGLKGPHKTFSGTTKKCENKNLS